MIDLEFDLKESCKIKAETMLEEISAIPYN